MGIQFAILITELKWWVYRCSSLCITFPGNISVIVTVVVYTTKELYKAWLLVYFEHVFLDLLVSIYNCILRNNIMHISGGHNSKQSSLLPSSCGNAVKVGSSLKPLKIQVPVVQGWTRVLSTLWCNSHWNQLHFVLLVQIILQLSLSTPLLHMKWDQENTLPVCHMVTCFIKSYQYV